jgi:hypothetical protein
LRADDWSDTVKQGGLGLTARSFLLHPEPLFRAVVEPSRSRALVSSHFLSMLERAAVGEVGGDPRSDR